MYEAVNADAMPEMIAPKVGAIERRKKREMLGLSGLIQPVAWRQTFSGRLANCSVG